MPPKSQRDDTLSALATRIFAVMLDDIVMDVTLQSHHETIRTRSICSVCKTRWAACALLVSTLMEHECRCGAVHTPSHNPVVPPSALPSRPSTPAANGSAGTGTSTPTSTKADGSLYLECVQCSRQIASNRYAPHLSSCMGLSTSRRGAVRASAAKSKPSSEAGGRSTSPEAGSEDGKGKGKSKAKNGSDLKRKRPESPQLTPNKKQKKQGATGSPLSRVKASTDASSLPPTNGHHSPSKVPSKLRDSSTASLVDRSLTPSSRFSSPGPDSPASSPSYSLQSPSLTDKGNKAGRVPNIAPPKPSPPRPVVDDYLLDDGGDETGSSTDTDSS
ncbi:hypothetical protein FB45DRAFT_544608 [Roridomyces roridus]|uniref:SAGA-associated factor 11 n=1 Tax=Roridomyces roridus TaxID=1738132 RepID=A0AAD7BU15_9AGAR|nr:hypothetical protein FB45DRAFT_544608 [Roridomyces roridus]